MTSPPPLPPAAPPSRTPSILEVMEEEVRTPAVALALRIALLYFIFGILWIAASDYALNLLIKATGNTTIFNQTVKGWFFIALTATLLFFVIRRFILTMQNTQAGMRQRLEGVAEQYRMLFSRNPSAMLIFNPTTRKILAANDFSLLLYGFSRDELLNMTTLDLVVEEERPRVVASAVYKNAEAQTVGPYQVRRRDGRIIFVEAQTHQVEFDGNVARIALLSDVTERLRTERSLALYRGQLEQRVAERTAELSRANHRLRQEVQERLRMEEDLRAASAAAEAANNAKSTFLAQTSHEIRTPLTSILGYADLLQSSNLSAADRARYLEVVHDNARHLSALIDDLLDLSRAQMGNLKLILGEHSPRQLAMDAIGQLQNRAAEKGVDLRAAVDDDLPSSIRADGLRVRQVLLNLMDNAIKFTPQGSVLLTVRRAEIGGKPAIQFEVADTGLGIAPDYLQDIFEPFFQIEQGSTRRFGGSGLGLSVSRQLALLMGGDLAVASRPGGGSLFTFTLPLPQETTPTPDAPPPAERDTLLQGHILLAEDNDNIRLLVNEYLIRAGVSVTAVVNGLEAVDKIKESITPQSDATPPIDLVLLDLHMPVLDGLSAMKQIRKLGYRGPIVGLTADFSEYNSQHRLNEGWDAICAKPIDRHAFLPRLAQLMQQQKNKVSAPAL